MTHIAATAETDDMSFRMIDTGIWADPDFRSLNLHAQLAFFMVLMHPKTTIAGTLRATIEDLSTEFGEGHDFAALVSSGILKVDAVAGLISIPNFDRYTSPENRPATDH